MPAECAICFEEVNEVGEIDGCCHVFCVSCIRKWAETETSCPLCKVGFGSIRRKRLAEDQSPDRGNNPHKRFKGTLLGEEPVQQRKQKYQPEGLNVDLDELRCQICGSGEDPESLLLCDSCDRAAHTYCVGLHHVPTGRWDCPACTQHRQARARRRHTAAANSSRAAGRRAGAGSTRSNRSTRGRGTRTAASAGGRSRSRGARRTRTGGGFLEPDSGSQVESEADEEDEGTGTESGSDSAESESSVQEVGGLARRRQNSRRARGRNEQRRSAQRAGGAQQRSAPRRGSRAQGGRRQGAVELADEEEEEEEYVDSELQASSDASQQGDDDEEEEWQEDWASSEEGQGSVLATHGTSGGGPRTRRVTRRTAGRGSSRSSRRGGSNQAPEERGRSTVASPQGRGAGRGAITRWTRRVQRMTQEEATRAAAARVGHAGRAQERAERGAAARQPAVPNIQSDGNALAREIATSLSTPSPPVDLTMSGHRTATRTVARARNYQQTRHEELARVEEMRHRWHAMRQEEPSPQRCPQDLLFDDTPGPQGTTGQRGPSRPSISRRRHVLDDEGSTSQDEPPLAQRLASRGGARGAPLLVSSPSPLPPQARGGPPRSHAYAGSSGQGGQGAEATRSQDAAPFLQRVQQRRGAQTAQGAGSSSDAAAGPSSAAAATHANAQQAARSEGQRTRCSGGPQEESAAKQRLRAHVQGLQAREGKEGLAGTNGEEQLWRQAEEARQRAERRQAQQQQRQQQRQEQWQEQRQQQQRQQLRSITPPFSIQRPRAGLREEEEHRGAGATVKREQVSPSKYAPAAADARPQPEQQQLRSIAPSFSMQRPRAGHREEEEHRGTGAAVKRERVSPSKYAPAAADARLQPEQQLPHQRSRAPQPEPRTLHPPLAIKAERGTEPAPGHAHARAHVGGSRAAAPSHTPPPSANRALLQPPLPAAPYMPPYHPPAAPAPPQPRWHHASNPHTIQRSMHPPFTAAFPPHPSLMPHCSPAPHLVHTAPPAAAAVPAQLPWHRVLQQPAPTPTHQAPVCVATCPHHSFPPTSQCPTCNPAPLPVTPPWLSTHQQAAAATPAGTHSSVIPATPSDTSGRRSSSLLSPPTSVGCGPGAEPSVQQQQQQQQQQGGGGSSEDKRARWERKEIKNRVLRLVKDALHPVYDRLRFSKDDFKQITVDATEALALAVQNGTLDERDTESMRSQAKELVMSSMGQRGLLGLS